MRSIRVGLVLSTIAVSVPTQASAAYDCGRYMRSLFGIADKTFNRALHWATLPHTSLRSGVVVVSRRAGRDSAGGPGGHVAKVEQVLDRCTAIVRDNRGRYKRNICKNLVAFVSPSHS